MKIAIIGAGVAGLSAGWRLAQSGASVEIFERAMAGSGATWAAAGMLAATAETGADNDEVARFAREARTWWNAFANELEHASGVSLAFTEGGSLLAAATPERAATLQELARALAERGARAEWLDATSARKHETLFGPAVQGAVLVHTDAWLDNRALVDALRQAAGGAGALLRENCPVRAVIIRNGRICGMATQNGDVQADAVIVAAGAWSGLVNGLGAESIPVRAAKGQMTALALPSGRPAPRHLIWGDGFYLVPRGDRLFLGATVEDTGFDISVRREAREQLVAAAARILPDVAGFRAVADWAGLRPRGPDGAPLVGPAGIPGLYVVSGQFRNGILFAPLIAGIMHDLIMRGISPPLAFDPRRFRQ